MTTKQLQAVTLTLHWHYTHVCTVSKVIGINTENSMSAKQRIHKCPLMIKNKYSSKPTGLLVTTIRPDYIKKFGNKEFV